MRLLLLGRPECGLCEEFELALRAAFPQVEVEHADVDSREEWRRRWGLKVPVLLDQNGELVCATFFDASALSPLPSGEGQG